MAQFTYRLQLLLEQKEEAKKNAERELKRCEQELETQISELERRRRVEQELIEKRKQLRRDLMSKPGENGTLTAREVFDRSEYIKVVGLEIEAARAEIVAQEAVVQRCERQVQEAKARVEEARREAEVLTKHRKKQEERFLREAQAKEDLELDEIGNVLYSTRQRPT